MLAPVRTAAPSVLPVSLEEAKAHLRVDIEDEDALIERMIAAATAKFDGWRAGLGLALIEQTWEQAFPWFADALYLPLRPVAAIDSVLYYDADNALQPLDDSVSQILTDLRGPKIVLAPDQSWPLTYPREDAVTVTFTAGYGACGEKVPEPLRQAILLTVGHWYENREPTAGAAMSGLWNEIPMTVTWLLADYQPTAL